jgi:tetratricopeptide (TPR) repeat protein
VDDKDRFNDGIKMFERALALDPKNVPAMTGLASVLHWRAFDGWTDDWEQDFGRAEGLIKRALVLQPENSMLRVASAEHLAWKQQYRAAVAEAETAISYDRNNALAQAMTGFWKQISGPQRGASLTSKPPCGSTRTAGASRFGSGCCAALITCSGVGNRRLNGATGRSPPIPS